jgi:hypothetical protein
MAKKLAGATMARELGRNEEDWKRQTNWGCNTYMLFILKHHVSLFLSFMFFLLQNQRTGGQNRFCGGGVALVGGVRWQGKGMVQIMYTHLCKCKNNTC